MSHQPFEAWILDFEQLSDEDRHSLQEHLSTCNQCQRLQSNWQGVSRELHAPQIVAPAPGFTQRWQSSLAERRVREQRRQAWRAFRWFLGGAFCLLLFLAGYTLAVSSPAEWMAVMIRYVSNSLNLFDSIVTLVQLWVSSTPLVVNLVLWIYLTITLCLLTLGWVLAIWRTSITGVLKQ